jgi:TonB-linked SusC/RagA family outer membrane protein
MKRKNQNTMPHKMSHKSEISIFIVSLAIFTLNILQLNAQSSLKTISGEVIDAVTLKPIPAAQISVPLRNTSAVSDENGKFEIKGVSGTDVLVVTAFDFNKREVALRGGDKITIKLYANWFSNYFSTVNGVTGKVENSAAVNSLVTKTDVAGVASLSVDETFQQLFGGNTRTITRSGTPGVGSSVFIRGINSLNGGAQPLYVVDGVVWNSMYDTESIHKGFYFNPLSNIDINDIQNVTVLKDGTSLYGSKAANGVILINTRRSTSEVTKISLNILNSVTEVPGSLPMMQSEDFRIYAADVLGTKGVLQNDISSYGFLNVTPGTKGYSIYHNNTDWNQQIYQRAHSSSYLINVDGGDDKAKYYFSIGLTSGNEAVKTTSFQRINARINADIKMTNRFDVGINIGFSRIERSLLDDGINQYTSPRWVATVKAPFLSPYSYTSAGEQTKNFSYSDDFEVSSPLGLIQWSINKLRNYRFNIGIAPVYRLKNGFTVSGLIDYNLHKNIERHFVPMYFTAPRYLEDKGYSYNQISNQVIRNSALFSDVRLIWEKKIDVRSKFKAMYGMRYINNIYDSDYVEEHNSGFNSNTTITGNYSYKSVAGVSAETRSLSNYLNADYEYDKRFFVNAVMSLDASSRFGNKTKGGINMFGESFGLFPAINGSWLVSSEEFLKYLDFISLLKLKAGYGITGNDGIQDYESMAYFKSVRFYDRANGLVISNLENNKIKWETTYRANLGIDLGLFSDRLNFSFDLFSGITKDLLVIKDLPLISGIEKYWTNDGSLRNKGYEVSANAMLLNLKTLKWEVGASIGHYANQITKLNLPGGKYTTKVFDGEVLMAEGQPAGVFYGYKTQGVFVNAAEAQNASLALKNADGTLKYFGAGDIHFEDVNSDGIIDENDRQVIGDPNPDFYGNFTSKWNSGRFTLSAVFSYSFGGDIYNYYRQQLESGSGFLNQTTAMLNRWTADGQATKQPRAVFGDPMGNARFSDRWIEDGSYLRLKNVKLAYDLPLKSNFIEGLNIWLSTDNVFTLTRYLGLDPEFSAKSSVYYQGIDAGLMPLSRSYYLGIKLNL